MCRHPNISVQLTCYILASEKIYGSCQKKSENFSEIRPLPTVTSQIEAIETQDKPLQVGPTNWRNKFETTRQLEIPITRQTLLGPIPRHRTHETTSICQNRRQHTNFIFIDTN